MARLNPLRLHLEIKREIHEIFYEELLKGILRDRRLLYFSRELTRHFGELVDSRTKAGKTQQEPRASCGAREDVLREHGASGEAPGPTWESARWPELEQCEQ